MKTSIFHYRSKLFLLFVVFSLSALIVGCSDEENGPTDEGESALSVGEIILNPKSAGLADTVQVTAVVTTASQDPGMYPTISWEKTEGVFLEDNQLSVRWVAPGRSTVARLMVTATNSVGSVSLSTDLFVGTSIAVVGDDAGELRLKASGTDLYYLHSTLAPSEGGFDGYGVYEYAGGSASPVIDGDPLGLDYVFSADLTKAARTHESDLISGDILAPINIWIDDILAGTSSRLTADGKPDSPRHDRFVYPYFSPNGDLLAYEAFRPNIQQGATDTFDLEIYDYTTVQKTNVTKSHGRRRHNFFPTISSDGDWLVFVSDRANINQWELYGLRFDGVMTDSISTVRLTNTDGLIAGGTPLTLTYPPHVWNPNPSLPVLAIIGNDGELRLVQTNGSGATTTEVTDVGNAISGMVWSPDGQLLAVASRIQRGSDGPVFNVLHTVTVNGVSTVREELEGSDRIGDMTWSPDQNFVVYRVIRSSSSWLELKDLEGSAGFVKPLVLTATSDPGDILVFRDLMSTSSVYTPSNVIYYLLFETSTPSINMLDISGAIP